MSLYDAHIMVDWSGGNDTGPTPRKDAIWICDAGSEPAYFRNRGLAEAWLLARIEAGLAAGERLCIGFDFAFSYPDGFVEAVTGSPDPLQFWTWLEARIEDGLKDNNRFDVAAGLNRLFGGIGPFWGNGLARDIDDLPRKGTDRTFREFPEKRQVELRAKGAFPCWQLSGAGAVGGQVLMGLPVLARLRSRFSGQIGAWPFDDLAGFPVSLVEIWPSLLAPEIAGRTGEGDIKDAVQVRVVAETVARLDEAGHLNTVLRDVPEIAAREGWIFGVSHEALLRAAAVARPNRLPSNCFALPPGVTWTPVEDALARLRKVMRPVASTEVLAVEAAAGRFLAEDALAERAHPPAPNSAVDGFGFHLDLKSGSTVILPLVEGRAAAGVPFDGVVPEGHAVPVLTGAILPDGVNTVALQEDAVLSDGLVTLQGPIKPGANTRAAGEDVAAGAVVLPKGHGLHPQDIGLLSAVGCPSVQVHKRLRVRVISTGDELKVPGEPASDQHVYDANGPMLAGMLQSWGYEVSTVRVGDQRDALRDVFEQAASEVDAMLTSGGASQGAEDHVSALLSDEGQITSWRVALKPGRPLALAQWRDVPIFGLPGNPVAAFVCTAIFARPALRVMAGGEWTEPQGFDVPAAFSKRKKDGRREYLRARLTDDGRAEVFASEGSGRISGLSWATGLVELPHDGIEIAAGDPVRFIPFAAFGL